MVVVRVLLAAEMLVVCLCSRLGSTVVCDVVVVAAGLRWCAR